MVVPNITVAITGKPKAGKNWLAFTFPEPIRCYCFNGGADYIRGKFPDKEIDVVNIALPILESENASTWATPVWEEFYEDYKASIDKAKYQTYVIDTGTELETILRQYVLEEIQAESRKERQKLSTTEYGARNLRMSAVFSRARNAGVNLVTLQYMREKWEKNVASGKIEPTGEMIMDGWQQTDSIVDVPIYLEEKAKAGKSVSVATIQANRFDRDANRKTFEDMTYDDLVAVLFGED